MGCGGSKAHNSQLVGICRERRDLIRNAANYRYALAAAHVSYFLSLKDVGFALQKFVEEELVAASLSPSDSSPSLILPPPSKKKSYIGEELHLHDSDDEDGSHIHISESASSSNDSDDDDGRNAREHKRKGFGNEVRHVHVEEESSSHYPRGGFNVYPGSYEDGMMNDPFAYPFSYPYPPRLFEEPYMNRLDQPGVQPPVQPFYYSTNTNMYYMKKSNPVMKTVVQEPPPESNYGYSDAHWNSALGYGSFAYAGDFGSSQWDSPAQMRETYGIKMTPKKEAPPPPSPKASGWDFFNPFDVSDNMYPGYYSSGRYGYELSASSPESSELRKREGIPDLEEDTENEQSKVVLKGKKISSETKRNSRGSAHPQRAVPLQKSKDLGQLHKSGSSSRAAVGHKSEGSSVSVPSWSSDESEKLTKPSRPSGESENSYVQEILKSPASPQPKKGILREDQSSSISVSLSGDKSSPEILVSDTVKGSSAKRKGVSFEVEGSSSQDADSSKLSSVTLLSPHGSRDLQEVVTEIRDDFEIASSYGKEVAAMLEVGKLPHRPSFFKVILYRIICSIAPSLSSRGSSRIQSVKLASRTMKLGKSYFEDVDKDANEDACNLSSTLDKLYTWEKKLYKEVKDEEKFRAMYEKQCRRLRKLDKGGAETSKLDATQASIRRLQTKLNVSIKTINSISSRIHKLRDEELQPQVTALIHCLIRMWKAMLKFHQKQFQAIMDTKMQKLKANINLQSNSASRATTELERELSHWCDCFIHWIGFQKSYVKCLNGWLLRCLQYEAEESPDGPVPYSPGKLGAPPIFIICNDWHQALEAISEARVATVMNNFMQSLKQLGEKQDDEGRQRLKAEFLSKDYERHLRTRLSRGELEHEQDAMPGKMCKSLGPSDKGVSPLDDLKVDLDSMKQRLAAEKIKHKDTVKLVHDAASSSLQGGLVPIFKALDNFTAEALKLHERVRLKAC